jgi:hypothetical protein
MANAQLKHQDAASCVREKPSTQFSLKIKRNVYLVFGTSKDLVLGHMAVATRPGRPPIRGKVEAASPRSVVMVLSGGRKRRLSRSVWSVAPVVGTQVVRNI